MVHMSTRNIQAINMFFSSWALVFLAVGIIIEEWVELKLETKKNTISHSPWISSTTIWPEDDLEVVRIMLILVLSLSFFHNLFLGLEFTYLIPQTKHTLFIIVFLSFLTGILLLCALLLYHQKLRQGQSVYYASYKITWIIFTAYLNVFVFIACGILSLLQHKQSINSCACLTIIHKSASESQDIQQSGNSIKVISLPARTAMPRSIVRVHSSHTKEDSPNKSQIQTRRVTWAL
ncbi:PREDICTED: transmembrane protein 225 [Ceratotherium simum simum]|uniref:Transmembrane protein 225 n=1 Tax=Ceratotherium simum simum TaxID=73337 RepID=A0ABM0HHM3_CERSS|nr:PREDICTED: transmembrane protein 225 [Ceratotherium simum simum]